MCSHVTDECLTPGPPTIKDTSKPTPRSSLLFCSDPPPTCLARGSYRACFSSSSRSRLSLGRTLSGKHLNVAAMQQSIILCRKRRRRVKKGKKRLGTINLTVGRGCYEAPPPLAEGAPLPLLHDLEPGLLHVEVVSSRAAAVAGVPVAPAVVVSAELLAHETRPLHVHAHGGRGATENRTQRLADERLSSFARRRRTRGLMSRFVAPSAGGSVFSSSRGERWLAAPRLIGGVAGVGR